MKNIQAEKKELYGSGDHAKFLILAERRTQQALLNIRKLAMTDKKEFQYTKQYVDRMLNKISEELENTRHAFNREMK